MIVTIHQPEFLPWMGFFDRIQKSNVFVILDDVGYEKNQFNNRNKIKTKDGWQYITVPVQERSPNKKINEVLIDNSKNWQQSHLSILKNNYSKSPFFNEYYNFLKETYSKRWEKISDLDIYLIKNIINFLGIEVGIEIASQMDINSKKTEKIVDICKKFRATEYLAGPGYGGKSYMDLELFKKEEIRVVFQEFSHPQYQQQYMEKGFLQGMSILDLLFNCGPESLKIIQSGSKNNRT